MRSLACLFLLLASLSLAQQPDEKPRTFGGNKVLHEAPAAERTRELGSVKVDLADMHRVGVSSSDDTRPGGGGLPLDKNLDEPSFLRFFVFVYNLNRQEPLTYLSWTNSPEPPASLVGADGQKIKPHRPNPIGFKPYAIGKLTSAKFPRYATDFVVFEMPKKIQDYTLELPGKNIGQPDKKISFKIPEKWFHEKPDPRKKK